MCAGKECSEKGRDKLVRVGNSIANFLLASKTILKLTVANLLKLWRREIGIIYPA